MTAQTRSAGQIGSAPGLLPSRRPCAPSCMCRRPGRMPSADLELTWPRCSHGGRRKGRERPGPCGGRLRGLGSRRRPPRWPLILEKASSLPRQLFDWKTYGERRHSCFFIHLQCKAWWAPETGSGKPDQEGEGAGGWRPQCSAFSPLAGAAVSGRRGFLLYAPWKHPGILLLPGVPRKPVLQLP